MYLICGIRRGMIWTFNTLQCAKKTLTCIWCASPCSYQGTPLPSHQGPVLPSPFTGYTDHNTGYTGTQDHTWIAVVSEGKMREALALVAGSKSGGASPWPIFNFALLQDPTHLTEGSQVTIDGSIVNPTTVRWVRVLL